MKSTRRKRSAEYVESDEETRPRAKRVKEEPREESTVEALLAIRPFQETGPKKHLQYWYTDGTIVVVAGDTAFRLHRTRLAQYCTAVAAMEEHKRTMEGCPLFEVEGLDAADFESFLCTFETPFGLAVADLPQKAVLAVFRAASVLGCEEGHALAAAHLHAFWPPDIIYPLPGAFLLRDACAAVRTGVAGVRGRAFYELSRSAVFWEFINSEMPVDLDDAEEVVERMKEVKEALWKMFKTYVLNPPGRSKGGCVNGNHNPAGCANKMGKKQKEKAKKTEGNNVPPHVKKVRVDTWKKWLHDGEFLERAKNDPFGQLQMMMNKPPREKGSWCGQCLDNWKKRSSDEHRRMWEVWNASFQ